jgi:hypothetical protein
MSAVIGLSEATALRKRFMQTVEDAHNQYNRHIIRNGHRGCQRAGAVHRRTLAEMRHYLKSIIVLDVKLEGGAQLILLADTSVYGRLRPTSFLLHPKKRARIFCASVELSAHALDRLIQYFRMRDFTRMPDVLGDVVMTLNEVCAQGTDTGSRFYLFNQRTELEGHLVISDPDGEGTVVATTFIPTKSYTRKERAIALQSTPGITLAQEGLV